MLALSIGARFPDLPGPDLIDADGAVHPRLVPMGLPVLSAPAGRLGALRTVAVDAGLHVLDFPTAGQQTTDYAAFAGVVADTPTAGLGYLGVAL